MKHIKLFKNFATIIFYLISYNTYANTNDDTTNNNVKYNPLSKPNTYQNEDNPNYWKNKLPYKGYWQQDVHYTINAVVDEETDIITASQNLIYTNNSPDSLNIIYFHLYQNAFQPDSYLDELYSQNNQNPKYGKYEQKKLGTIISDITVNGEKVQTELDNTILKVHLPRSLYSNSSISVDIEFKTYFDNEEVRRRMTVFESWGYKHYNGVHWYPRICVYDSKFGWTKDQHLGKEFYGNFGTFDVELDFASNFIVEATGFLTNRNEVLPDDLRKKLDVKNFKNKEWNSTPSIIIPYNKKQRKIWKFHAENVHDFAFTADPTYRIGESKWEDKICYSLVQEPHASRWQNAADFGAKCLQVFSEDFGRYVYHKVIVADARSGMEYPMITLDSGHDPGYRDLLAHEIGHMWFFGQVGNNETYRALLDEGFTQFLTSWAMIKIDGDYMKEHKPSNNWEKKYLKPLKAIDSEIYNSYIYDATKYNDPVISTHSDCFNGALRHGNGYRHVYYKTAAMLYNLEYVLGDSLFLAAMKNYFSQWKIAHPYNEDFRNSIIQFTKVDLNWFFDQWLESTKRIDYSVKHKKNVVTFKRKSRMEMPIDFTVLAKNGKKYDYHIPNKWFVKKTKAEILPKWHAWDLLYPKYTIELDIPSGIDKVIIDPSNRLADAYMPDNNSKMNISVDFDYLIWNYPDWKNYEIKFKPDVWWNNLDGLKLGLSSSGGYLNHHHIYESSIWLNSKLLQNNKNTLGNSDPLSYKINYKTNLDNLWLNSNLIFKTQFIDGLHKNSLTLEKSDKEKHNKISIGFLSLYRKSNYNINYNWERNKRNNRIDLKYEYKFEDGNIKFEIQSSALASNYDYSSFSITSNQSYKINYLNVKTRTYLFLGFGDNWANESKVFLSGANYEQRMRSKYTRADGIISSDLTNLSYETNHFHYAGGLNLRGYSGYLAPAFNQDGTISNFEYSGTSGASINCEVDFSYFVKRKILNIPFSTYFFADAGVISSENLNKIDYTDLLDDVRVDAGMGLSYNIYKIGPFETIKPLTLRLDFPIFLNRPPANSDFIKLRWLFGLNKVI